MKNIKSFLEACGVNILWTIYVFSFVGFVFWTWSVDVSKIKALKAENANLRTENRVLLELEKKKNEH